MKQINRTQQQRGTRRTSKQTEGLAPVGGNNIPNFEQLAETAACQVEHRTVFEFLRGIPHRWHPDEIGRFGDRVGRMANQLQLAFVPSLHPQLGVIRSFPVPLMQWLYTVSATQFGWPQLDDAADAHAAKRDELRKAERLANDLQQLASATDEPKVLDAAGVLVERLTLSAEALKAEMGAPAAATTV